MERQGVKPKNHMKDNLNIIKATQDRNRELREDEQLKGKELYKLSQFRDVGARVFEPVPVRDNRDNSLSDRHEGVFLVRGASEKRRETIAEESRQRRKQIEDEMNEAKMYSQHQPSSPRKRSVPRADDIAQLAPRENADFVSKNRKEARRLQPPKAEEEANNSRHESYGRVPEYLEHRKAQWADLEEDRRRRAPDPNCPPGMCIMPEDERQSTLQTLLDSKRECQRQLEKLPFVIETPSMRRKADDLENKMREIEKAIEVFSKPKVYVAL